MDKIILDTNVIVSALLSNSFPSFILSELVLEQKVQLLLSKSIFEEYSEVLTRTKFQRIPNFLFNAEIVLSRLEEIGQFHSPKESFDILKDKDDNMFLELASIANAHYIITGNTNDFTITSFMGTKIISPSDYWNNYLNR